MEKWQEFVTEEFKKEKKYKDVDKVDAICYECKTIKTIQKRTITRCLKKRDKYFCNTCITRKSIVHAREVCKKKYGGKNPFEIKEVQDKIKKTNKEKYGVESLLELKEIRNKAIEGTNCTNVSQLKETKQKVKKTMETKYGGFNLDNFRERVNQSKKDNKEKRKKDLLPLIIKDLESGNIAISNKEFYEKYGISYTTIITYLREAGRGDLVLPHTILDKLNINSYEEAGNKIVEYAEKHKYPILGKKVQEEFNLAIPSIRKILELSGNLDLIGKYKSAGQREVYDLIKAYYDGEVIYNDRSILKGKELDIYIPELKLAIEFNGLYWHCELHKDKWYHFNKRVDCEAQGIRLIQINEDEWTYKRPIVESMLKLRLGVFDKKIFARKTELKPVPNKEANEFLKENHLMGEFKTAKYKGLYYEGELVSLMGYKKHKEGIDISRFCNKKSNLVLGGLSKLLKSLEKEEAKFIQYYIDLRYGTGKAIESLGYECEKTTLGWKWTDWDVTYNRLFCKANMDSRELSEIEHAMELEIFKFYDAGQGKYVKSIKN